MYVGSLGGLDDLGHVHLPAVVTVLDVLRNGSVKEGGFLRNETHLGPSPGKVESLDVAVLNIEIPVIQVIQALDQLKK